MPFHIMRNDITKMHCDAIVNTANAEPTVGAGCDWAIYQAAGYRKLLEIRKNVGLVREGDVFLTPGLALPSKYIIHAVSPQYRESEEAEERLRSCYRKSLALAADLGVDSIAFPLIAAGSFHWPREEAFHIAAEELRSFSEGSQMDVYLVVFGEDSTRLGLQIDHRLESYIDSHYVRQKMAEEYEEDYVAAYEASCRKMGSSLPGDSGENLSPRPPRRPLALGHMSARPLPPKEKKRIGRPLPEEREPRAARTQAPMPDYGGDRDICAMPEYGAAQGNCAMPDYGGDRDICAMPAMGPDSDRTDLAEQEGALQVKIAAGLEERMKHRTDTFSEYLLYLIGQRGMTNAEVYKRALVDKKTFSKIKNNPDSHPQKITCMCLCMGAQLNLDETKDLLSRAGYALSPCEMTDIIFSFFIESGIYDMIELDLQLEEYGLPCLIS